MAGGEPSRDVGHEHRKGVQQRIDQTIKRRRGCKSSVQGFVPCHGRHYPSGLASDSSKTEDFCILWNLPEETAGLDFRHTRRKFSANPHQFGPPAMSFRAEQRSCARDAAAAAQGKLRPGSQGRRSWCCDKSVEAGVLAATGFRVSGASRLRPE